MNNNKSLFRLESEFDPAELNKLPGVNKIFRIQIWKFLKDFKKFVHRALTNNFVRFFKRFCSFLKLLFNFHFPCILFVFSRNDFSIKSFV